MSQVFLQPGESLDHILEDAWRSFLVSQTVGLFLVHLQIYLVIFSVQCSMMSTNRDDSFLLQNSTSPDFLFFQLSAGGRWDNPVMNSDLSITLKLDSFDQIAQVRDISQKIKVCGELKGKEV